VATSETPQGVVDANKSQPTTMKIKFKKENTAKFLEEIQRIQNALRDLRDNDLHDNDPHWYAIIDGLSDLTNIQPE
jgi:hypothetical protein